MQQVECAALLGSHDDRRSRGVQLRFPVVDVRAKHREVIDQPIRPPGCQFASPQTYHLSTQYGHGRVRGSTVKEAPSHSERGSVVLLRGSSPELALPPSAEAGGIVPSDDSPRLAHDPSQMTLPITGHASQLTRSGILTASVILWAPGTRRWPRQPTTSGRRRSRRRSG